MAEVSLTLACGRYDRTEALANGRVRIPGVDLTCVRLPVEEVFFRMLRFREFDAAEMSLSSYVMTLASEPQPFVAIPVFPSRAFRHSSIYVNADSGVSKPSDLAGRRVGIPEYQMTAAVWIRGILAEHHGLAVSAPEYATGGLEQPGRIEKIPLSLPSEISIEAIGSAQTLSKMLAAGEIDGLYTARQPSGYGSGDGPVRRLFPNPWQAERDYLAETSIFPIMHTVVIRRDVFERQPWLAQSLAKGMAEAKRIALEESYDTAALPIALPWLTQHIEDARATFGEDYWSYGFGPNRHVLEKFLEYSHGQGLSPTALEPEELFAESTLETTII